MNRIVTLQNEFLKVDLSLRGAQVTSIFNKSNEVEHLWQADPAVWAWHAPNLFPVVGGCYLNEIIVNSRKYPMARHGFARNSTFKCLERSDRYAKFSLRYSQETLKIYPFKFTFEVRYALFDSELKVSFKVINEDDGTIYFSVGAHPAFNIPFFKDEKYNDYYIEFNTNEQLIRHLLTSDGLFSGLTEPLHLDNNKLHLTKGLFLDDALVFKTLHSREVLIKNHKTPNFISISFPEFESLGIWAAPGADFVCVEPWLGYADQKGGPGEFRDKEGIRPLEFGHVFEANYIIGVN